jgi:hypothetical protein
MRECLPTRFDLVDIAHSYGFHIVRVVTGTRTDDIARENYGAYRIANALRIRHVGCLILSSF